MSSKWGVFGKSFYDISTNIEERWKNVSKTLQATNDYTLQNIFNAWKISSPVNLLADDEVVSILDKYNRVLDSGAEATAKFLNSGTGNDFMDSFLKDLDGAPATMGKYTSATKEASKSHKAFSASTLITKASVLALNTAINAGLAIALAALSKTMYEVAQSEKILRDNSKRLGDELVNNTSTIQDYKDRINTLKDTLNDSSSSFEEVSQARVNLMGIQDELIEKFGTEKGVIEDITEAIYGQTNALDQLSKDSYYKKVDEFNQKTSGDSFIDWLTFGNRNDNRVQSNMDKMIQQMESSIYTLETTGNEVLDNLISKSLGLTISSDTYGKGKHFTIYGELDDIQEKLTTIREMASDFEVSTGFENNFTNISNDVNSLLEAHQNLYDQYLLWEKILTDNPDNQYDEQYDLINKAKEEYNKSLSSGNVDAIQKSSENYSKTLFNAIDLAMSNYDYDVASYFENMYPDMQQIFSEWKFTLDFEPNTEGLKDKVSASLTELNGFSSEDILAFNPNVATDEQITAYGELNNVASEYGLTLQGLVNLLLQMGLIQSESYQQMVNQFGQNNINKISPEDLTFAYQIKNVGNMTFEEFQAKIQRLKNETQSGNKVEILSITETVDQLKTQLKPSIDSLADAYQNIFTEDGFTRENIGLDMFSSIKKELDNLQGTLAESGSSATIDYSAYERLVSVLNDSTSTAQEVKDAFDEVALSVANVTLTGIEDFEVLRKSLAQLGYVDADLVAFEALVGNMEALKEAGLDLANPDLTKTDLVDFVQSLGISAEYASEAVNILTFAQQLNKANSLDTSTSVAGLLQLATDAGYTGEIIQWLTQLMKIYNYLEQDTLKDPQTVQDYIAEAEALTQKIKESAGKINVAPNVDKIDWKPAIKSAEKAGKDAGEEYKEALEEELSDLGDVLNYITDIIGDQIDAWNDQKDAAVDALEAERDAAIEALEAEKDRIQIIIDAKQDEIDKIKEAREEREAEIDLQKKQYELARLENQRTMLVKLCQTL